MASGASDGSIAFWDLRGDAHPVTILQGHEQAVNEVQFHAQQPHHMFSCSERYRATQHLDSYILLTTICRVPLACMGSS